jgi:hypothetical protein
MMGEEGMGSLKTMNTDPKRFKKGRGGWLVSAILSFLCCVVWVMSFGWHRDYQSVAPGPWVGNKVSSVGALKENGLPFSFLVMGDPEGSPVGARLMKRAIKEGPYSFMVILGDVVNDPDMRFHRYFLNTLTRDVNPSFPVFLVSGNHDINYTGRKKMPSKWEVTHERYDSLYGSRHFDFVFNNCLFLLGGFDDREPEGYLTFFRKTLAQKGQGRKHIFIFMHWPPEGIGIPGQFPIPGQEDFLSLVEKYHVTTCFFGDYHGYLRAERKGTNLIVSGGGGGRPKKIQSEWGKFYHLLRITVDKDGFTEGMMISTDTRKEIREVLKEKMFVHLFPRIEDKGWVLYLLFVSFLVWGISSVIIFSRLLKKK